LVVDKNSDVCVGCSPLRTVAFRGHGFSLLAPARGMPTLSAKAVFSRPSSTTLRGLQTRAGTGTAHCSSHQKPLRLLVPPKTFVPTGQGRLRQHLHRTKKTALYLRGVNGPPLQTTIIIVKASYKYCCQIPC